MLAPELPTEIWIKILLKVAKLAENNGSDETSPKSMDVFFKGAPFLFLRMVSKTWKSYLEYDGFWFEMMKEKTAVDANYRNSTPNPYSFKLTIDFLQSIPHKQDDSLPLLYGVFQELCKLEMEMLFNFSLTITGLLASSTDHYTQSITSTLSPDPFKFWSSKGVSDQNSDEYLLYQLYNDINLVHSIAIKPFLAQYQRGFPCYAPQYVSFSIGFSKEEFHYESCKYPIINRPILQRFYLPALVAGSFVRINLHGRNQNQPGDLLFYTCIEEVQILGIPGCSMEKAPLLLQSCIHYTKRTSNMDFEPSQLGCDHRIMLIEYLEDIENSRICLELLKENKFAEAVDIMAEASHESSMRKNTFLLLFKNAFKKNLDDFLETESNMQENQSFSHWFRFYISKLFDVDEILNADEAIILAELCKADKKNIRLLDIGINRGLIHCTAELGAVFEENDPPELSIAYFIYVQGRAFDKILDLSLKLNNFRVVSLKVNIKQKRFSYRAPKLYILPTLSAKR